MRKRVTRYHLIHLLDAQPALPRVNKQIRAESLPMYHAETTFGLDIHIRDDYTADLMWQNTLLPYPADQIHNSISFEDLSDAVEVFAPAQGQNGHNPSHWRHIRHVNAQIEINFVFFHAHLYGSVAAIYPPESYPDWRKRPMCDLANIARVDARIDSLIRDELLIMHHGWFAPKHQDTLIEVLLLFSHLFPEGAKCTWLHLNLSAERRSDG